MWAAAEPIPPGSWVLLGIFLGFVLGRVIFGRRNVYRAGHADGRAAAAAEASAAANVSTTVVAGNEVAGTHHHHHAEHEYDHFLDHFGAGWDDRSLDHLAGRHGAPLDGSALGAGALDVDGRGCPGARPADARSHDVGGVGARRPRPSSEF